MRYAIAGQRPGENFILEDGTLVATDPIDGGAELSQYQKEFFENHDYTLLERPAKP